jgi:hypothetical protein
MRLKATTLQRVLMLGFMVGVGLWSAWPNWKVMILVVMGAIAFGLYLFGPGRRRNVR